VSLKKKFGSFCLWEYQHHYYISPIESFLHNDLYNCTVSVFAVTNQVLEKTMMASNLKKLDFFQFHLPKAFCIHIETTEQFQTRQKLMKSFLPMYFALEKLDTSQTETLEFVLQELSVHVNKMYVRSIKDKEKVLGCTPSLFDYKEMDPKFSSTSTNPLSFKKVCKQLQNDFSTIVENDVNWKQLGDSVQLFLKKKPMYRLSWMDSNSLVHCVHPLEWAAFESLLKICTSSEKQKVLYELAILHPWFIKEYSFLYLKCEPSVKSLSLLAKISQSCIFSSAFETDISQWPSLLNWSLLSRSYSLSNVKRFTRLIYPYFDDFTYKNYVITGSCIAQILNGTVFPNLEFIYSNQKVDEKEVDQLFLTPNSNFIEKYTLLDPKDESTIISREIVGYYNPAKSDIDIAVLETGDLDRVAKEIFTCFQKQFPRVTLTSSHLQNKKRTFVISSNRLEDYIRGFRQVEIYSSTLRGILTHHLSPVRGWLCKEGLFLDASAAKFTLTKEIDDFRFFASRKWSAMEILARYISRGFPLSSLFFKPLKNHKTMYQLVYQFAKQYCESTMKDYKKHYDKIVNPQKNDKFDMTHTTFSNQT
jgi:hypothetical protein